MQRNGNERDGAAPTSPQTREAPEPPKAPTDDFEHVEHGVRRPDPWHWLKDREDPRTLAYLRAENAYTDARAGRIRELADTIFEEMKSRLKETDLSVPWRKGTHLYYARTIEGHDYAVWCRRPGSMDGEEQVLIDGNALAEGKAYFELGGFAVTPDEKTMAYAVDFDGDERYEVRIVDIATGEPRGETIPDTAGSLAWTADGRTLFYNRLDERHRPYRLLRHRLGTPPADDALIWEEPDERFFVAVGRTRSGAYVLLEISSTTTTGARFLPTDDPLGEFRVIEPRRQDVEYDVDHHDDRFLIVVNDEGATDFRLVEAPVESPGRDRWRERIPCRPGVYLEGVDAFRDHLVIHERRDGLTAMTVHDFATGQEHELEFDEAVYTLDAGTNAEFDTGTYRFVYSSLVTPRSVYDLEMATGERTLLKRQEVLGGYDPAAYTSERLFATSPDGTEVPISLVHRRDLDLTSPKPTLLYGYGAYGIAVDPTFGSGRVSLLDRGFVYAIAHVRGGCELGRSWYEAGRLAHKEHSFDDFLACARALVDRGITRPELLAAMGGSAGGLLVGTAIQREPALFRAAVAQVPLVDVLNTMLDPTLPLTVTEYEQWGDPTEREVFDRIRAYTPYENVAPARHPDLLVTAGLSDPRVGYWEPAKWVAKLRATADPRGLVLLRTNLEAGHQGASGRYDAMREAAFEYAFVVDRLTGDPRP